LEQIAVLLAFEPINWGDYQRLGAPTSRQSTVKVIAHDGEVQTKEIIHFVLPLEGESCRAYDQDALGRFATEKTSDEKAGLDRFAESDIVGKQVTETVGGEDFIEKECLVWEGLNGGFGESTGNIVFTENQPCSEFPLKSRGRCPVAGFGIGERVRNRLQVGWRYILQIIDVVEGNLKALVTKGVFLDVAYNTEAVFGMTAVNNAGVGGQGG
jgi:hypothetical protein